jgi:hypothetical protein
MELEVAGSAAAEAGMSSGAFCVCLVLSARVTRVAGILALKRDAEVVQVRFMVGFKVEVNWRSSGSCGRGVI